MTPEQRKVQGWIEVWRQDRADVPQTGFNRGSHWGTREQAEAVRKREIEVGRTPGRLRHAFIRVKNPLETYDGGFWEKVIGQAEAQGKDTVVYENEGEKVGGKSYIPLRQENVREIPSSISPENRPAVPPEPTEPLAETVTPAPAEPLVPQLIGIKNASVDVQRADRGLPPIMSAERLADPVLWDRAMAQVDADPALPNRLTRELLDRPRPMTDTEDVIMGRQLVDLTNQLDQARWEGIKARDAEQALEEQLRQRPAPDAEAAVRAQIADQRSRIREAEARAGELSDALAAAEQAIGRGGAGTEMGRAFRARQFMLREDFTLAGLERQMRANKGFDRLSSDELATARRTAEEFAAKNQALEARLKDVNELAARAQAEKELAQLRATEAESKAAVTGRVKAIVEKVGSVLDQRADAARERLRGKLFTLSPDVLADLAEIGASNLYHIGMDLAKWSAKMVEDLGERIRPHLDEIWKASQRILDESARNTARGRSNKPVEALDDAEKAINAIHKRLEKRIADYEARIKAGDFSQAKRKPVPDDKETNRLRFELEKVKRRFYEGLIEAKMAQRTTPQRVFGAAMESVNAMRAILTSADLSAVLRQGGLLTFAHPLRSASSIVPMLKAFASEAEAFRVEQEIQARPNYPLYRASKLYLAEHGALLSKMEEAYMSRWASKIPGVGPMVKASERAYTTFLNKLRADSFDAMKATLGRGGDVSTQEARIISNFVNVATGRGTIGMQEQAAVGLNTVFFAPRFVASRFQTILGQPLYYGIFSGKAGLKGNMRARGLVAAEYGRILAGAAIVYGLGTMAGASIEVDPRSSDFAKMRWGNTRVDPMSGLLQITVLLSKVASGSKKTLKGKVMPIAANCLMAPKTPWTCWPGLGA